MKIEIYGAGMAGLLAANMLRRFGPTVHEAKSEPPNTHGALLRFRTDVVSRATNIPFKKVRVFKAMYWDGKVLGPSDVTLQMTNLYSLKVTQRMMYRSAVDLDPVDRYIAPWDFIEELAHGLRIEYGSPLTADLIHKKVPNRFIISTVPMNRLMNMVGWEPLPEFRWQKIWTVRIAISDPEVDVYQTIYYPSPNLPWYRASITGDELIIEYITEPKMPSEDVAMVMSSFGFPSVECQVDEIKVHTQKYGKLSPIDDQSRRAFILAATDRYRIYSVGRFATWRQLLLDDVVHDVEVVERFITDRDDYARHLFARNR